MTRVFLSVRPSVRTWENNAYSSKILEITLPNFICIFIGQFHTDFVSWPLTYEVKFNLSGKTKISKSSKSKLCKISTPDFECNFIIKFSTFCFMTFYLLIKGPYSKYDLWPPMSNFTSDTKMKYLNVDHVRYLFKFFSDYLTLINCAVFQNMTTDLQSQIFTNTEF